MEIRLEIYHGDTKKGSLTFAKQKISVGRELNCDVIINDAAVSSNHFNVLIENGKVYVEDCGSVNGTFVNGKQVAGKTEIFPGDKISFCGYVAEVMFEGEVPDKSETPVANIGNKTVVIEREDFLSELKKASAKPEGKRKFIIYGVIGFLAVLILLLALLPSENKKKSTPPVRVDEIDAYFVNLEKSVGKTVSDRKNEENAKRFYELGMEKLKLANLNKDSKYNALVYFLKAKKSVEDLNPKPPVWDKIIPEINKTRMELKLTLKKLFKDAWLLENDGNKEGARDVYEAIMQTIPDENSPIYIKALRRYNLLK